MNRSFTPHRAARAVVKRAAFNRRLRLETLESRLALAADFGDAPLPYPTTLAENGASHEAIGPTLGATRDTEANGTHSAAADADGADDDGVLFGSIRVGQLGATATVNVQNAPAGARMDAWIDFNADGSWGGPGEQIADRVAVAQGDNTIRFDVPSWAADGQTFARFRLSTAGDLGIRGAATDGEVEDYAVSLLPPAAAAGVFGSKKTISTTTDGAHSVFAADVDGDGDMDVLSASQNDDKIAWYENNGSQTFTARTITTAADGAAAVLAADVDGDGDVDVLSASYVGDTVDWYENNGNQQFTARRISASANGAVSLLVADVDGDGDNDVLSASGANNRVAWHENDGSQTFTTRTISGAADFAHSVFAADMDRDGDSDVLSASFRDDKIAWYENNGGQVFTEHAISTAADGGRSVFAADMEGDGDLDVLSASDTDDKVAWYENNGNQVFTAHTITTAADGLWIVFAADADGDGDMDVLSASSNDDKIAWYENDGNRNFTARTITTLANGARSMFAADVDSDGDLDVLSASFSGDEIAWYENEISLCVSCADGYIIDEDAPLIVDATGGVLANDGAQAGEVLTASVVSTPNHGVLTLAADGSFTYTPAANFFGEDSFTYRITSDQREPRDATVTITVRSVNDLPTAGEDEFTLQQGTSISLGTAAGQPGIFAGTSFADPPTGATTFAGSASELGFEVTSGLPGTTIGVTSDDRFIARGTTSGVMTLNFAPVDIAGHRDVTVRISARSFEDSTGSDFEPTDYLRAYVALERIGGPIFTETIFDLAGTALKAIDTGPNGPFASYSFSIPNSGFIRATFVVEALVDSNSERVWVDDIEFFGLPVSGQNSLLANDSDADDDPLTVRIVTQPAHGTLVPGDGGALVYTPDPRFFGDDRFTYVVNDGQADSNIATVTLHVRETNLAPVARNDAFTTLEDVPLVVDLPGGLLANDTDGDNHPLSVRVVTQPAHGALAMFPNGTFKYVPAANHHGADSFSYVANDARDDSNVATVGITITSLNDPPATKGDVYAVESGQTLLAGQITPVGAVVANSIAEFSNTQGRNNWFYGYYNRTLDADRAYQPANFIAFPNDGGPWGPNNYYDPSNGNWRFYPGYPPWTAININDAHGNGTNSGHEHWAIRRYVSEVDGPVTISGVLAKSNTNGGDGVTGHIFVDGLAVFSQSVSGTDSTGISYSVPVQARAGSFIDLALTPNGGDFADGTRFTATVRAGGQPSVAIVPSLSLWRYLDDGTNQGTAWRETAFDDDAWRTGRGQLGYGDGDEATTVGFGPNEQNKFATTYFRHTFQIDDPTRYGALELHLLRDDGAAVYLNGVEIARSNLAANIGYLGYAMSSLGGNDEHVYTLHSADVGLLRRGPNVIAAEVHQYEPASSDISFDLRLSATLLPPTPGVMANDRDADLEAMSASLVAGPFHGTLDFNDDGSFSYTPDASFTGVDQFSYVARDATSVASAPTRVTINVGEVNLGPTAVSDLYLTAAGRALVVAAAGGLLANDFDPNGDPLAATLFEPPEHGTLDLLPDGGFSYTPPDGFFGRDTFRYAAGDGSLQRGVATVTIVIPRTIDPIDSVPMAAGDRYQVAADSPLSVPASSGVLANDADPEERPLLAAVLAPPRHGTLDFSEDGAFIYRPLSGVHGTDSFVYRATDGNTWSGESLVLVEVLGPGLPQGSVAAPVAGDVNRDGQVTAADLSDVLRRQFTRLGMAAYDPAADVNGDGRVNMQDAVALRNLLGVHSTVAAAAGAAITAADEPNVARSRAQAIAQWPIVRAKAHRGPAAIENSPIRIQDRDLASGPTLRAPRNSRSTAPSRRLASEAVFRSLFSEE
jgi:hypothetical protein